MINLLDIFFLIILVFFIIQGSRKGPFIELLKIIQIVLAITIGLIIGVKLGSFIGEFFNRPRFITIPVIIILLGSIVFYIFHIIISKIYEIRIRKEKNKFNLTGIILGALSGSILIIFIVWNGSLLSGILNGKETVIEKTRTFKIAQPIIYNSIKIISKNNDNDVFLYAVSNPAKLIYRSQIILSSSVIQRIISDPNIGSDILSSNEEKIKSNASIQALLQDKKTMLRLRAIGIDKHTLINQILKISKNKTITRSIDNLRSKNLLNKEKYFILIRDPDFDNIIGEILKWK